MTDIAIPDQQGLTAQGFSQAIGLAHEKAETLQKIVEEQHLYVDIGPKRHLLVEAWQTIAMAYKLAARTDDGTTLIYENGKIIGVEAKATVVDIETGAIVGGATSYCFGSEEGKGDQAVAQWAGMAQTRASARALKQVLSWVVVLAGYSPTPAEEMMAAPIKRDNDQGGDLMCPIHSGMQWFKSKKMRVYAHPVDKPQKGENKWCKMEEVLAQQGQEPTQDAPTATADPEPEESPTSDHTQAAMSIEQDNIVDLDKLMSWAEGKYNLGQVEVAAIVGVEFLNQITDFKAAQYAVIASQG